MNFLLISISCDANLKHKNLKYKGNKTKYYKNNHHHNSYQQYIHLQHIQPIKHKILCIFIYSLRHTILNYTVLIRKNFSSAAKALNDLCYPFTPSLTFSTLSNQQASTRNQVFNLPDWETATQLIWLHLMKPSFLFFISFSLSHFPFLVRAH